MVKDELKNIVEENYDLIRRSLAGLYDQEKFIEEYEEFITKAYLFFEDRKQKALDIMEEDHLKYAGLEEPEIYPEPKVDNN